MRPADSRSVLQKNKLLPVNVAKHHADLERARNEESIDDYDDDGSIEYISRGRKRDRRSVNYVRIVRKASRQLEKKFVIDA